jgi:hypothetical protein
MIATCAEFVEPDRALALLAVLRLFRAESANIEQH